MRPPSPQCWRSKILLSKIKAIGVLLRGWTLGTLCLATFCNCYISSSSQRLRFLLFILAIQVPKGIHEKTHYYSTTQRSNFAFWLSPCIVETCAAARGTTEASTTGESCPCAAELPLELSFASPAVLGHYVDPSCSRQVLGSHSLTFLTSPHT